MIEWGDHARFVWNSGVARVQAVLNHPEALARHVAACDRDPSRRRGCALHGCAPLWMPQWLWREVWASISSLGRISTELRHRHSWLAAGPSAIQQDAARDLRAAYVRWLDPDHPARRPRPRRRTSRVSLSLRRTHIEIAADDRWPVQGGGSLSGRHRCVRVPKTGLVRFRVDQPLPADLSSARLVREPCGDWFVSFTETPRARAHRPTGITLGLDIGVTDTIHVADGSRTWAMRMPELLTAAEQRRLGQLRRRAARQQGARKGEISSNGRQRTVTAIARLRARETRRRRDWIEKATSELVERADTIVIEDLHINNMVRSARGTAAQPGSNVSAKRALNRALLAVAASLIRRRLADKCRQAGVELVAVNPRNTSRTCSQCGDVDARSRRAKRFCCRACGFELDADANAAINIRALGLPSARRRGGTSSLRGRQARNQAERGLPELALETRPADTIQRPADARSPARQAPRSTGASRDLAGDAEGNAGAASPRSGSVPGPS